MTSSGAPESLLPEDVRDYPRPPELQPVPQRLRAVLAGSVVGATERGLRLLEAELPPVYFFPPEDVLSTALLGSADQGQSPWLGVTEFLDVRAYGVVSHAAAWRHPEASGAYAEIAGYIAFFPEKLEACFVGDELVRNLPGSSRGGWLTSNLTGLAPPAL